MYTICKNFIPRYLIAAGKCGRAELFARASGAAAGRRLWSVAFDSELEGDALPPPVNADHCRQPPPCQLLPDGLPAKVGR